MARFLLAAVVVATTLVAIRYHPGLDLINNIWAPIRGLAAGLDPYDPSNAAYIERFSLPFRNPVFAAPYVPAALTLFAPLAPLTQQRAVDVMAVLNAGFLWTGVLLLITPRNARTCLVAGVAGSAVILTSPAQITIDLGQLSALAFAGLALLVARLDRRDPRAAWVPALGAAVVALKPQSAIPMTVALAALGLWPVLWRMVTILVVSSLPGLVLFIRTVSSPAEVLRVARDNLAGFARIPTDDLANAINLRLDALGLLSRLGGPALNGLGWLFAGFLVLTALFILALRGRGQAPRRSATLGDPWVVMLLGLYIATSLYHLMYDQLLLYVGPLMAIGMVARGESVGLRTRVIARIGVVLLVTGIAFRTGFFNWVLDHGAPLMAVWVPWVVTPSLITLAALVWGMTPGLRPGSGGSGAGEFAS